MAQNRLGLFLMAAGLLAGAAHAADYDPEHDIEYVAPPGRIPEWQFGPFSTRIPAFFWVRTEVMNDGVLKLSQVGAGEYSGRIDVIVTSNVNLDLSCSLALICKEGTSEPVVPGDYSCRVAPSALDAPGGQITIHVTVQNADVSEAAGCLVVANVTLTVRPRIAWQYIAPE